MSLVAYETSSDDDSDNGSNYDASVPLEVVPQKQSIGISEDEDFNFDYSNQFDGIKGPKKRKILLPPPTVSSSSNENKLLSSFQHLPLPKTIEIINPSGIEEEDDEFLHKKEKISEIEKPPPATNLKVKITIPALSDFKDVNIEKSSNSKTVKSTIKSSSLLNLLPKPKSELNFSKTPDSLPKSEIGGKTTVTSLIPESVKNRQRNLTKAKSNKSPLTKSEEHAVADTSDSDNEGAEPDFFSLNTKNELPEVNMNEINDMVAKRAAQMAEASKIKEIKVSDQDDEHNNSFSQNYHADNQKLDQQALKALVGTSRQAKRRKANEINVIDLSGNQVLPNRDEWLRAQLTSSTTYQPVGVLVDQEVIPGTRRKHQITYLAHQAKANEAELEALWAANRQTKRQTQNKYGF